MIPEDAIQLAAAVVILMREGNHDKMTLDAHRANYDAYLADAKADGETTFLTFAEYLGGVGFGPKAADEFYRTVESVRQLIGQ